MSQLVENKVSRKDAPFPPGSKWIKGSDYDMAYHHIKSLILDRPLYLWNKDNNRHLFIEVDSSDDGWVDASTNMRKSTVKTKKLVNSACSARNPNESYRGYLKRGPTREGKPSHIL